jgi:hypothetical protein
VQWVGRDAEGWRRPTAQNRQRVLEVGASALHIPLLGQGGLELGLGLIQDDRAHEPGPERHGEEADLLPVRHDGFGQDLGLRIQRSKRVVELGHARLDGEPDHGQVIGARRRLGPS